MTVMPVARLLALPGSLGAQEASALPAGTRIRVTTTDRGPVVGALARLRNDTLAVVPDGHETAVMVPWTRLKGLAVSRGRHARTGRGALIGLASGLVGGLGLGGALAGLGIGALVGSFIRQEKWREAPITWMRTGATRGDRQGLSLAIPFRFP